MFVPILFSFVLLSITFIERCASEIVVPKDDVGQKSGVDVTKHHIQILQSSQTLELGMRPDTVSSYEEFSVNNGRCMYKNGTVTEGGTSRPATDEETQKLHAFKQQLAEYGVILQQHMTQYLGEMLKSANGTVMDKGKNWPMAPTPPCFCVKCVD